MFPNFLHVELAGFCCSRVLLAYKLSMQSDRIGDWQIGRITGLIAQRDDLDIMTALEKLVPGRNVANLAAVRGAAENAPKILAHYIGNEFDRLVMYATQNPGASLDWMWRTNENKVKKHLGRMFAAGLGGLKYKLILWCMQHGEIPTRSNVWVIETSLTEQEVSPEDRAAVAEIRRLFDLAFAKVA